MRGALVVRVAAVVVAVLAVLTGTAVIGYRVFAPHEILTRPTGPYPPENVVITADRPFSELRAAPLVVDGRLRVYAEKWRVWSDAPVGERYESTPYWAFRRWPAQVVGVVAAESDAGAVVVSQWSDGQLIAVDARTGAIAWRVTAPIAERTYPGRRTGASVVYQPRSLVTARAANGAVVILTAPGLVRAYDPATGETRWERRLPGGCEPQVWTGATLVAVPDCAGAAVVLVSAVDGRERARWAPEPSVQPRPALCELGRSECPLITVGPDTWLLGPKAKLTAVPPVEPNARLAGSRVVYPTATGVAARPVTEKAPDWTWVGDGDLVAADAVGVYLLTSDRTVLGLNPDSGHLSVLGCASSRPNEEWRVGHAYPTGGNYLALERITTEPADADDQQYYFGPRPVALVELYIPTKLPIWPGKFAACGPAPR